MSEAKDDVKGMAAVQPKTKKKEGPKQGDGQGQTVMYLGPTIKGVVATGTIYSNGLPKALEEEMKKQPLIKELLTPVGQIAEKQKALKDNGSAISVIYGKIITE